MVYMMYGKVQRLVKRFLLFTLFALLPLSVGAQVGEYRNELAAGVNGGLIMSSVSFVHEIPQNQLLGKTFGLTLRYTGEKYFSSICAVVAEVNYAQVGWDERIWDVNDDPVINDETGLAEEYSRVIDYIQVPVFARLGWGRERRGFQAYFQIGPQIGFYLSEKTKTNFDIDNPNMAKRVSVISGPKYSNMYHMPVENKFDYGIAGALGVEFTAPKLGHFMVEGRYYFGLGNIYGNSKRDFFSKSNIQNIVIKASYLFDLVKSKNPKIK